MFNLSNSILALCLTGVISACFGQSQATIDSLTNVLASTPKAKHFEILQKLHDQYKFTDYTQALDYARAAYKTARQQGDSVNIIEGGRMIAFSLIDLGKNQEALQILDTCLQIAQRNEKRLPQIQPKIKSILNNMGIAEMHLAQYDKALSYHFQSLILREEEGNQKSIATSLSNIGLIYYKLDDVEKALKYYERALTLKKEINDYNDIETILINMGLCYIELNQHAQAIETTNQALKLCDNHCSSANLMYAYFCNAVAYTEQNALKEAEAFYIKSLKLSEDIRDIRYSMLCLSGLSQIEFSRKNYDLSLRYLLQAQEKSNSTDYPETLMNIHKQLARVYKQKSDLQNAFTHQSIHLQLLDSIYNAAFARSLAKVQTEHEERENRKALADKDKLVTLQAEALETQQRISLFIGLIVLLSIIVILSIYRNYRLRVRINKVLDEKVKLRTRELEESRDNALRNAYLQDHRLTRITNDIQDTLVTMQGLCLAARLEVAEGARIYLDKLEDQAGLLKTNLTRFKIDNSPLHQKTLV